MAINLTRIVNVTVDIRPPEFDRLLDHGIPVRTSLRELWSLDACGGGVERFIDQIGFDLPSEDFVLASSLVGGHNTIGDLLWLLERKLGKVALRHVANRASLLVQWDSYLERGLEIINCADKNILWYTRLVIENVTKLLGSDIKINDILRDVFDNGLPNT